MEARIVMICFIVLMAIVCLIMNIMCKRRELILLRERAEYTKERFVADLAERGVPSAISQAAYDYFRDASSTKALPIHPDDDLYRIFGTVGEDIDDTVLEIAKLAGCREITQADFDAQKTPVRSVSDVTLFLSHLA